MDERIYTERKIVAGVAIGGPLAGGYYFWRTFNALGMPKQALWCAVGSVAVLAICISFAFIPGLDRTNGLAWALQIGLTYGVTQSLLKESLAAHIADGKPVFGWGNTILVGVIFLVITVGPFLVPSIFDTSVVRYYGRLQHEIHYVPGELRPAEVDRVADALTATTFFDEQQRKFVDLSQSGRTLTITISCSEEARSQEAIDVFRQLRHDLQQKFSDKQIVIDMVVATTGDRIARLE
jgi:hypothetical protein